MAGKMNLRDRAKSLWLSGMKAVGNTAASIASNTRYKVDEVTLQNRRREVLGDLAVKAYALWLKGEAFPEEMDKMLRELNKLDEQLNDMRAEKYASRLQQDTPADAEETAEEPGEPEEPEQEEEEEDPESFPAESSPVRAEINELFDAESSVGSAAAKVNSSLQQLSDRLQRFPKNDEGEEKP